jgi:hypothetical protein
MFLGLETIFSYDISYVSNDQAFWARKMDKKFKHLSNFPAVTLRALCLCADKSFDYSPSIIRSKNSNKCCEIKSWVLTRDAHLTDCNKLVLTGYHHSLPLFRTLLFYSLGCYPQIQTPCNWRLPAQCSYTFSISGVNNDFNLGDCKFPFLLSLGSFGMVSVPGKIPNSHDSKVTERPS